MKVVQNFHTANSTERVDPNQIKFALCSALQWKHVFPEDTIEFTCTRETKQQIEKIAKGLTGFDLPWKIKETCFTRFNCFYDTARFFNMACQTEDVVVYMDPDCLVFKEVLDLPNWKHARENLQHNEWAGWFCSDYRYTLTEDQDFISRIFFNYTKQLRNESGYWNTGFQIVPKKLANLVGAEVVKYQALVSSLGGLGGGNGILETTAGLYPKYLVKKCGGDYVDLSTPYFMHTTYWIDANPGVEKLGIELVKLIVSKVQDIILEKGYCSYVEWKELQKKVLYTCPKKLI